MVFPALGRISKGLVVKLTQKTVDALVLPKGKAETIVFDQNLGGFGLRLRRGGSRSWVYQFKIGRRVTIGNAAVLSAVRAREAAVQLHSKVRLGRANEIGALRWSEIVDDTIQLTPLRTKNNRGHIIPITAAIRTILDGCQRTGDVVFGRSQGFRGWAWGKERLDQRIKVAGGELQHWTHHDLRRTMATRLAEFGTAPHIIEAVLGHAGHRSGVHGIYNRAGYENQKRVALEAWAAHVEMVVSGKQRPETVVRLRGA
jgi:hypothetical protein